MKKVLLILLFSIFYSGYAQDQIGSNSVEDLVIVNGVVVSEDYQPAPHVNFAGSDLLKSATLNPEDSQVSANLIPLGITVINFDDNAVSCFFGGTSPASTEYTSLGVTFGGTGFSILDECGNFGVTGHSSPNFMAWNTDLTSHIETITFDPLVSNVSFNAASQGLGSLTAQAFDIDGVSLGSVVLGLANSVQTFTLPYSGIASVTITAAIPSGIIDDLSFDTFTCPEGVTVNNDPGECGAIVEFDTPDATQTEGLPSGSFFPVGTTVNTYTDPDCSFSVTVEDAENPYFPAVIVPVIPKTISQLGRKSTYSNVTLNGGANAIAVSPGATVTLAANWTSAYDGGAGCPGCITQHHIGLANIFSLCHNAGGSGAINYTFTAPATPGIYYINQTPTWWYYCGQYGTPVHNNDASTAIAVLVVSDETFGTCFGNILVNNDPGVCGAIVNYFAPVGMDNCSSPTTSQITGLSSGSEFPVGTTTNTFEVTDASGNKATCSFDVTVIDNEDPTAICQNIEVYLEKDGTVTIEPEDVDDESMDNCGFQLSIDINEFSCDDLGENEKDDFEVTLTVTDDSGNTDECIAVVTVKQRPTTLTYDGDLSEQYSDEVSLSATLVDDLSGDPIEGMTIAFEIGTQSTTGVTDEFGVATATLVLTQDPCDHDDWVVTATFEGDCPFWESSDEVAFDYQPEDADMEYTGTAISATSSMKSNNFVVTLRGIIIDREDDNSGDIGNAMARFLVNGSSVCDFMPVIWLDEMDKTIGMIQYDWASAISSNPTTYDVQIELDGCYYDGISIDYPLTVYNSVGDFVTGGGHLIMTQSAAGFYAPSSGSKLNFGFNVKFNKSGKNLQGKMNIIYRVLEEDEVIAVYQIKSTSTTSLGTNKTGIGVSIAEFVSKANLTDVTDPDYPVELGGNLTLHVTMTDRGEPGNMDMIGFSLYDGTPNALWMSSNWTGTKTAQLLIDGGNLLVHTSAILSPTEPVPGGDEGTPNGKGKNKSAVISGDINNNFSAYPNPFSDRIYFEFSRSESGNARLELFDATGRVVSQIFDQNINSGETYRLEIATDKLPTNMLFYRMTFEGEVLTGKLVHKR